MDVKPVHKGKPTHNIFNKIALLCMSIVLFISVVSIVGWISGRLIVASYSSKYIPMAFTTALFFALISLSFLTYIHSFSDFSRKFARVAAITVIFYSFLTLLQLIVNADIGIDTFLVRAQDTLKDISIGHMSPITSLGFLLSGFSLLALTTRSFKWLDTKYLSAGLSLIVVSIGLIIVSGYMTGRPLLYSGGIVPVALPTAVAFVVSGAGMIMSDISHVKFRTSQLIIFSRGHLFNQRYYPVVLAFFTGVIFSITMAVIAHKLEQKSSRDSFDKHAGILSATLRKNIDENLEVLNSVNAFYTASKQVSRHEFQVFLAKILAQYSGIQAVEWLPFVPESKRNIYEQAAVKDGFVKFKFKELNSQNKLITAAKRKEYFPVYFIEPLKGNESALGFDVASNPISLEALEKARDLGKMAGTARIKLIQETSQQYGILIFQPIYFNGGSHNTLSKRRKNLAGFALGVFRVGDIVESSLKNLNYQDFGIYLYDLSSKTDEELLYTNTNEQKPKSVIFASKTLFDIAGRQWIIKIYPSEKYLSAQNTWYSWAVLSAGLIFTMMLVAYMLTLERHAAETEWSKNAIALDEARLNALYKLSQMSGESEAKITEFALEQGVNLTRSKIGYLYFFNEDHISLELFLWSKEVAKICTAEKIKHYPLNEAGIWADCIRQKIPVIHNDYQNNKDKKGYPQGHVHITRHMSIPIFDGDKIIAVAGVGNKEEPYDEADVRQFSLFMHDMWKLLEHKRISERILKARDFYLTLLETFPALIWRSGTDAKCDYFNKTWLDFTGRTVEQEMGDGWAEGVHREDIDRCVKTYLDAFNKREPFEMEYRLRRYDREYRWIVDFGRPFYDLDNKFAGYIGSCYDITDKKQAEEERLKTKKLESIGILAGGIAHDFNNLLTVIIGGISLARMRIKSDKNTSELLETAEKACEQAKELSYKLITFSKGGEPFKKISSILTLIKEAADSLLKNTNIKTEFYLSQEPYLVEIDEGQMRQVVNNLLINAKEAMPQGGNLKISVDNLIVHPNDNLTLEPGKYVKISISDSGVGIPEKNLSRIFDPYFTTKEMGSQKGMGLGLAVCYSIIKNHGGLITFESKYGAGSTFHLYLPASANHTNQKET
ncbi:MAG: CHASE domain-containing protein [Nitrospiraceae bacterium]|nr:CHASE domain-containing protein [Nitrospiraceae bacterium]